MELFRDLGNAGPALLDIEHCMQFRSRCKLSMSIGSYFVYKLLDMGTIEKTTVRERARENGGRVRVGQEQSSIPGMHCKL